MISVIVITLNRCQFLKNCLEALIKQKRPADEVVIVDNGSTDNTRKIVSQFQKRLPLKYLYEKKRGYGAARNVGVKNATGDIILFIDDDCLAGDNWIEKNIEFLKSGKSIGAVGGKISGHSKKFFGLCTDYTNFWRQQGNSLRLVTQLYTASLGVKKEAFFKVGGFDEKARVGEDVDFVNKLAKKGYSCYYNPEIVVFHDHQRDSLRKFLQYMYQNGLLTGLEILKTYQGKIKFFWPILENAYFFLVLPMAILYTGASLWLNLPSYWKMIFLLPFIFLGYLVYHLGIAVRLLQEALK